MSKINLEGIASKMSQNQMKKVLGGSGVDCTLLTQACTSAQHCTTSTGASGGCATSSGSYYSCYCKA